MSSPASTAPVLPEQFGPYRIIRPLGKGGMGAVYLARDTRLDREVALKVCTLADNPQALERFRREARAAAGLSHPNLCPVYEFDVRDGIAYLTMAFIEGPTLNVWVTQRGGLSAREAALLVARLALALKMAHEHGVVHRDLKPQNVAINKKGEPVILDFGLAKLTDDGAEKLTQFGAILGTPSYMAPEQVGGDTRGVGPGCDIYSLGVILYELLTGSVPFEGPAMTVLARIMTAAPPPPRERRPDLDERLDAICLRALAKDPADRFANMGEFAVALRDVARSVPATATKVAPAPRQQSVPTAVKSAATTPGVRTLPPRPPKTKTRVIARAAENEAPQTWWGLSRKAWAVLAGGLALAGLLVVLISMAVSRRDKEPPVVRNDTGTGGTEPKPPKDTGTDERLKKAEEEIKRLAALQEENKKQEFKRLLDRGKEAFDARRYDDAATAYADALKLYDDAAAKDALALAQARAGAARKAAEERKKRLEEYDRIMVDAAKAIRDKEYAAAVRLYEAALVLVADDGPAAKGRAEAQALLDKDEKQKQSLAAYKTHMDNANAAMARQDYTTALEAADRALTVVPDDPAARKLVQSAKGRLAAAKTEPVKKKLVGVWEVVRTDPLIDLAPGAIVTHEFTPEGDYGFVVSLNGKSASQVGRYLLEDNTILVARQGSDNRDLNQKMRIVTLTETQLVLDTEIRGKKSVWYLKRKK